ncbi:flagellar biosynthesis/type III secretory pathway chaperone [Halomonas ventosae]|uniref:Flagellar biosynthesis/type III secretory pathway chaperone n=1 Tax=Halomonas ventosae TaxID=229007 RepID=A0A4R6ZTM1_9GAMM|nr:flagellar protein FlgN [Halomonas ventosae]TDR56090.1 flagellar biosynthesis/type III secretory pathway chaperone [Halomonas ventosae]
MTLAHCLVDELAAMRRLMELLDEEANQLAKAEVDGDALVHLAESKQQQLERLGALSSERRELMGGEAVSSPERALEVVRVDGCEAEWQELLKVAEQVSNHNHGNGRMIQLRMEQNQRLLNMISEARGRALYNRRGEAGRGESRLNLKA